MTERRVRTWKWLGVAAAVATGLPGRAAGQVVPDSTMLPPIVVTATQVPRPADRLGQRVTVLSGAELRAAGVVTVADALSGLPGLTVVRTGSPGAATSVFLRGGESDYVKVLVDGVPVNEPGGAYDFAHLTLDQVERIEVVRGPASVLYGSDAVSGVVQIFTRAGGGRVDAGVRAGTYGTVELDAEVAAGGEPAAVGLAGRWTTSDGLYAFNSGYDNRVVVGRVRLTPDRDTRVALVARVTDADLHYPTDGAGNAVDRNQRQLTDVTTLGVELERRLASRLRARLHLTSNAIGGGFDDAPDGPDDTLGVYAFRSQRDLDRRGADVRLVASPTARVTLAVGGAVEHERERSSSRSESEFGPFESATDATRRNWAGYTEIAADVGRVAVTAGLRVDDNQRFGTFVTGRGGLSASLPAGFRAYGSAGSAFKAPTFFEQLGGGFVIGNPGLNPERTTSWEAGLERAALGGRVRAAATYFGQRFRDLIQFTFTPPTPDGSNYLNVAAASADGLELEMDAAPAPWLRMGAQYTYLRTEVTDAGVLPADDAAFRLGDRLLRRPTHVVGAHARARRGPLAASAAVRRVGERADADFAAFPAVRVTLPAYTVVDLGAEVELPRVMGTLPALVVTGRVENLLGHRYQEVFGFPARGRTILVGGRVRR